MSVAKENYSEFMIISSSRYSENTLREERKFLSSPNFPSFQTFHVEELYDHAYYDLIHKSRDAPMQPLNFVGSSTETPRRNAFRQLRKFRVV